MVRLRHSQRNLGEVFFAREAESLMEAWMRKPTRSWKTNSCWI